MGVVLVLVTFFLFNFFFTWYSSIGISAVFYFTSFLFLSLPFLVFNFLYYFLFIFSFFLQLVLLGFLYLYYFIFLIFYKFLYCYLVWGLLNLIFILVYFIFTQVDVIVWDIGYFIDYLGILQAPEFVPEKYLVSYPNLLIFRGFILSSLHLILYPIWVKALYLKPFSLDFGRSTLLFKKYLVVSGTSPLVLTNVPFYMYLVFIFFICCFINWFFFFILGFKDIFKVL